MLAFRPFSNLYSLPESLRKLHSSSGQSLDSSSLITQASPWPGAPLVSRLSCGVFASGGGAPCIFAIVSPSLRMCGAHAYQTVRFGDAIELLPPCQDFCCIKEGCVCAQHCLTFATPWTVALQAPLSIGSSRQEYWNGLPFPSPGIK